MIKIGFIIDEIIGLGGAEKNLVSTITLLDRREFIPEVFTFRSGGPVLEEIKKIGVLVHEVPVIRVHGLTGIRGIRQIISCLKSSGIKVIQTYHFGSDFVGAAIKTIKNDISFISNRRDMGFTKTRLQKYAYNYISPKCDKVIAVSEAVKKYIISCEYCTKEQVEVIYNGVEFENKGKEIREDILKNIGIPASNLVIGTISNLHNEKRPEFLLSAVGEVLKKVPNASFLHIGSPTEISIDDMIELAKKMGISNRVHYVGARKDARMMLGAMDIFVLGSRTEGMSNALLEAMACELPSVVTDAGGNSETIRDGVDGFIVPINSGKQFEEKIYLLSLSKNLRESMGRMAYKRAYADFSNKTMINKLQSIYKEVYYKYNN